MVSDVFNDDVSIFINNEYLGLQVLDNLVCESKFRLSKLHDGQFNK